MYEDDDNNNNNEPLPIPRRSLVNRIVNHFGSDTEDSPFESRPSRIVLNNSHSSDSGVDEYIQTPIQLIALYEKTVELASKNKINAQNAFHFSFVDRLPEILDIIAFDDKLDVSSDDYHEPNFVKAGSVIDTSAKIYGYRVDALYSETQQLNGTMQQNDDEEEEALSVTDCDQIEIIKKPTQRSRSRASSYVATDLSTISLADEFEFHPLQPSTICRWPGGVGLDSSYSDMISYTMYSSSDFPLVNGFVNLHHQINNQYEDNETILDRAAEEMLDLIQLRDVINEHDGQDHILGSQELRRFSFNEDVTESYIETVDECSIMNSSFMNTIDNAEIINDDIYFDELSEPRDDPLTFHFQELQSTHTAPTTMVSMDVTLMHSKMSFADNIPQLIRDQADLSEYSLFDSTKLKLFAGPHLWKFTNLLPNTMNSISKPQQQASQTNTRLSSARHFKLDFLNRKQNQSLDDLMTLNSWARKSMKSRKRKILSTILYQNRNKSNLHEKNQYQFKLSRKLRPTKDLFCLNYFPDYNLQFLSDANENSAMHATDDHHNDDFDPMDYDNPLSEHIQYDFSRPVQYERIEYDQNFAKIDAKKLQIELYDEYNRQCTRTTNPISLSTLCVRLIDQGMISYEKNQIVSAFYCMLNNCNKNQLYMKPNLRNDDLIIQKQSFASFTELIYSQSAV
ncbi:unnamed protein product [Rotaria socialis]|uniref:Condensin complex subunit 2 n=1 Tax=Rotaria socialis TaxID=392032 RepID=A0A821DKW0_9BILA|nr:unnamed protein product [Rotaria socialis]CAF4623031.1 unnamed protein product [Rotaria socialis]